MPLLKSNGHLLKDGFNNIYCIIYENNSITAIVYDKTIGNVEKKVIQENCTEYYFATIDKKNIIKVVCQTTKGEIVLLTFNNGNWDRNILNENVSTKIYEPYLIHYSSNLNVFYSLRSDENENNYEVYHILITEKEVLKNKLFTINTNGILNPYIINKFKDGFIISYLDTSDGVEELYVRYFDLKNNELMKEMKITEDYKEKLYLDTLVEGSEMKVTYCEKYNGNLRVVYKLVQLDDKKPYEVSSEILSNECNCQYPTLIDDVDKTWVVWYQYQGVVSSFKRIDESKFDGPYLWKKSKGIDISKFGFVANHKNLNNRYRLNSSFTTISPKISFIGFGPLEDVEKIPFKKKSLKEESFNNIKELNEMENKTIIKSNIKPLKENEDKKLENLIKEFEEYKKDIEENKRLLGKLLQTTIKEKDNIKDTESKINELQKKINGFDDGVVSQLEDGKNPIKQLEKRVTDIEDFLSRRRRGLFGPRN